MGLIAYNIHGGGHAAAAKQLGTLLETELGDVVGSAQTLSLPGASYSMVRIYLRGDLPWFKRWVGRLRVMVLMNTHIGGYKLERLC